MKTNIIYNQNCIEGIKQKLDDNSINLVITSPPYYNSAHKYQRGSGFHYSKDIGEPLYIIFDMFESLYPKLKLEGIVCLNLGFSYAETGVMRPFDIINRIKNKLGYFVNDIIIWHKNNPIPLKNRLTNAFEFIFILSKQPVCKYFTSGYTHNVWEFPVKSGYNNFSAAFPENLPELCIKHFSTYNNIILDPFMGSGTTALCCAKMNRQYIGFEINKDYIKLANDRLKKELGLFFD